MQLPHLKPLKPGIITELPTWKQKYKIDSHTQLLNSIHKHKITNYNTSIQSTNIRQLQKPTKLGKSSAI